MGIYCAERLKIAVLGVWASLGGGEDGKGESWREGERGAARVPRMNTCACIKVHTHTHTRALCSERGEGPTSPTVTLFIGNPL